MKVSVVFQVPSSAWTVQITDVYEFETEVWVAARVSTTAEVGLAVISTVSDSVTIPDTSKDIKYFILGKTWNWENSEPYEFVKASEEKQFEAKLKSGKKIDFVRDEQQVTTTKVSVTLQVPSTAWSVQITDVYEFEKEVWVAARLSTTSEFGLMMISTVSDSVTIPETSKDIKYFILGRTWNWDNSEPYEFVKASDEPKFESKLKSGKKINFVRG